MRRKEFNNTEDVEIALPKEHVNTEENDESVDENTDTALTENSEKHKQNILTTITTKSLKQATSHHALRYPDRKIWVKSRNAELDKINQNGTIRWLKAVDMGTVAPKTK